MYSQKWNDFKLKTPEHHFYMWAAMREECENSLLQIDTIWRAVKRHIQAHTPIPKYMLQVTYN